MLLPESTKEFIPQLLREKDEARQNYSQETIWSQFLAAELEAAQSDQATLQAQLTAATPGLLVGHPFRSIALSYFSNSFSDILLQSCSRRFRPSTPQQPPPSSR